MTREEIIKDYNVDANGVIRRPGKFEGEMLYVPYFWQMGLEGMADDDDGQVYKFRLTPKDRKMFPELSRSKHVVRLMERSDGFVLEV